MNIHYKQPVIISTDTACEIDDQWMLTYLLGLENINIIGIISAHYGNRSGKDEALQSYTKTETILKHSNRVNILHIKGSPEPLKDRGDFNSSSAEFLYKEINKTDHESVIIILSGPATDISSLINRYPDVSEKLHVYATAFSSKNLGQSFNVRNDIKAWQDLLDSEVNITVANNKLSYSSFLQNRDDLNNILNHKNSPITSYLQTETDIWFNNKKEIITQITGDKNRWPIWDMILVAHLEGYCDTEETKRPILLDNGYFNYMGAPKHRTMNWITECNAEETWISFTRVTKR